MGEKEKAYWYLSGGVKMIHILAATPVSLRASISRKGNTNF